jgi:hypothetical protein
VSLIHKGEGEGEEEVEEFECGRMRKSEPL